VKNTDGIVRVGGVGTGRIFQWAHLRTYLHLLGKARLIGFLDLSPGRAAEAMAKYRQMLTEHAEAHPETVEAIRENLDELRCYDSLEAMLEQVDAVDVATHARGRMDVAVAALEAGVHSMVEKPMARTWIEADRAARAFAERPEVFCQLNDDNVHEVKYRVLHDVLARRELGGPQSVTMIRGSKLSSTSVLRSQASGPDNGGGCLMDYGTHGLAGIWYALGTRLVPRKVDAVRIAVLHRHRVLEERPYVMEVDDNARVKVLFEDPDTGRWVTVYIEASWCGGHIGLDKAKEGGQAKGVLRVVCDDGVIEATDPEQMRLLGFDGGETILPMRVYPGETMSFLGEFEAFFDAIRSGTPPRFDVQFGAEILAIVGAAYYSAVENRAVTIEEFKDFSRSYVDRCGDADKATEAILADLLAPYRAT